jgi:predicted ester cyclase
MPSAEANKLIVLKLIESMDSGDASVVDTLFDPLCVAHFMGKDLTRVQMKEAAGRFSTAFPDLTHTVQNIVAEGDRVVLHSVDRATHKGVYRRIPPTGLRVQFETIAIYRIANGRIAEVWQLMDTNGLLRQLGQSGFAQ